MQTLDDRELYYLRSILGNLRDLSRMMFARRRGVTIQTEALGDNIDWLDCFIDQHERASAMSGSAQDAQRLDPEGAPARSSEAGDAR